MVLKNYLGCFAPKKTLGRDSAFGRELAGTIPVKNYMSTNTICEHNIPDILFLGSFNLDSTCSARGNVSYLFFFLRDKHSTFYGRLHVLYVSTI
jgi:hypothetical protein